MGCKEECRRWPHVAPGPKKPWYQGRAYCDGCKRFLDRPAMLPMEFLEIGQPVCFVNAEHKVILNSLKFCTTCDKLLDPARLSEYRQTKVTSKDKDGNRLPPKPNKCPCCHNTLRSSPVESKDLSSRKNKIYSPVPRMEADPIVA